MTNPNRITRSSWADGRGDVFTLETGRTGPSLLVTGAVHGDEICGPVAIQRVLEELQNGVLVPEAGSVTFIPICNTVGHAAKSRFVVHDLNRELRRRSKPECEEHELQNALLDSMEGHDVLLDIHSFKGKGESFVFLGPENNVGGVEPFEQAEEETAFAQSLGAKICVFGWLTAYEGFIKQQNSFFDSSPSIEEETAPRADISLGFGTVENFRRMGGFGVTIECGNHADPEAPERAYRAIIGAMGHLGILSKAEPSSSFEKSYHLRQVVLRQSARDMLSHDWEIFDPISKGDLLGHRSNGEAVVSEQDGAIIFTYPSTKAGGPLVYVASNSSRGASTKS